MVGAVIERLSRSLKQEAVSLHEWQDGLQAKRAIKDWITYHNTERPHTALDKRPPDDAFFGTEQTQKSGLKPTGLHLGRAEKLSKLRGHFNQARMDETWMAAIGFYATRTHLIAVLKLGDATSMEQVISQREAIIDAMKGCDHAELRDCVGRHLTLPAPRSMNVNLYCATG